MLLPTQSHVPLLGEDPDGSQVFSLLSASSVKARKLIYWAGNLVSDLSPWSIDTILEDASDPPLSSTTNWYLNSRSAPDICHQTAKHMNTACDWFSLLDHFALYCLSRDWLWLSRAAGNKGIFLPYQKCRGTGPPAYKIGAAKAALPATKKTILKTSGHAEHLSAQR